VIILYLIIVFMASELLCNFMKRKVLGKMLVYFSTINIKL